MAGLLGFVSHLFYLDDQATLCLINYLAVTIGHHDSSVCDVLCFSLVISSTVIARLAGSHLNSPNNWT